MLLVDQVRADQKIRRAAKPETQLDVLKSKIRAALLSVCHPTNLMVVSVDGYNGEAIRAVMAWLREEGFTVFRKIGSELGFAQGEYLQIFWEDSNL